MACVFYMSMTWVGDGDTVVSLRWLRLRLGGWQYLRWCLGRCKGSMRTDWAHLHHRGPERRLHAASAVGIALSWVTTDAPAVRSAPASDIYRGRPISPLQWRIMDRRDP